MSEATHIGAQVPRLAEAFARLAEDSGDSKSAAFYRELRTLDRETALLRLEEHSARRLISKRISSHPFPTRAAGAYADRMIEVCAARESGRKASDTGPARSDIVTARQAYAHWYRAVEYELEVYVELIASQSLDLDLRRRLAQDLDVLLCDYEQRFQSGEIPWLPIKFRTSGRSGDAADANILRYVRRWLDQSWRREPAR